MQPGIVDYIRPCFLLLLVVAAVRRREASWLRWLGGPGTALLTLVGVWRFARLFGSPTVAVFSVLALLMMPRFIGHAFNNSKDIPFACGFAWGMVGIGRLLSRSRWSW